ncbi:GNAT family N-acetyltransferase [Paenibacillus tarimensis]
MQFIVAAETDEANRPYVTSWSLDRHREALDDEDMLHCIVEDAAGVRVGYLIVLGAAGLHSTVELLRLVITDKGKGYGRSVLEAVQAFAFRERSARRLWLDVRERNARARRLYASCGFKVEGTMRDVCRTKEGYESLLIMSILAHEYGEAQQAEPPEPESVLAVLKERGTVPEAGVLAPRTAGRTDARVYPVVADGKPLYVLKYDNTDANRHAASFLQEAGAQGWMPVVRHIDPEYRYFVYDYMDGQSGRWLRMCS